VHSHGGGGIVDGGSKMVTHGGWQVAEKETEEQEIRSGTCGEECQHLRHHPAGAAVA